MTVKNICIEETISLRTGIYFDCYADKLVHYLNLAQAGWIFYVVDQRRGFCKPATKEITIPLWCVKQAINADRRMRLVQYILHEIAHGLDFERNKRQLDHGPKFMEILIEICPKELLIYEMTYKPKNLIAAGAVFCPDSLDF